MSKTKEIYDLFLEYPEISTDTRSMKEGAIFMALKGPNFDGNRFAGKALELGARAVVIDDPGYKTGSDCILVENSLQTLQELSRLHRQNLRIPVLAVTGSNGKTTTKELLHAVLSSQYCVTSTRGNLNNHIGVPLTLLSIGEDADMAVVEMGTNQKGEISFLSELCDPSLGIITSIGAAHLEGLGSIQGVIEEKTGLYRHLENNRGTIFFDMNSEYLPPNLPSQTENIGYSTRSALYVKLITHQVFPNIEMTVETSKNEITFRANMYGEYNVLNISAALAVGEYFEVPMEKMIRSVGSYIPDNNRSQTLKYKGADVYLDAYNANPSSMESAVCSFSKLQGKRKILILGDMLELGRSEKEKHLSFMRKIKGWDNWEQLLFVGPIFKALAGKVNFSGKDAYFSTTEELKEWLNPMDLTNMALYVKGSRRIGLEKLFV